MKKILGLDLGTNSIGWAVVGENEEKKEILGIGSRIIPMSQDILGKFDSGNSVSQTAERTSFRGIRRLRERQLLRRERLHRVLHLMGFLPIHYDAVIDFEKRPGKFINYQEQKIAWKSTSNQRFEFLFKNSFDEMLEDFKKINPSFFSATGNNHERKIPYDWTIYFLRKKALQTKIEKEELAWILLNFNQKRGYYQLRGEDEEISNKNVAYHSLRVIDVTVDEPQKGKNDVWYNVILENGWVYRRSSRIPLYDWVSKTKDFIVTTELNDDGTIKKDKEGNERRSFRAPSDDDWTLLKKKTETEIEKSHKTVGTYIYDALLLNPDQKIKGKLVRTIERKFYKQELKAILEKQKEFHHELTDPELFRECLTELYQNNETHRNSNINKDFTYLFLNDILFYQRPLKSKKSLISNCKYEYRTYVDKPTGEIKKAPIKTIPKSHPLYQELRLWKFVKDLRIYEKDKIVDGKLKAEQDVTVEFLKTENDIVSLFDWLNNRNEIKQDTLLTSWFKIKRKKGEESLPFRWNYVEDKEYPCNETRSLIFSKLSKAGIIASDFMNEEKIIALWHILYSIEDKIEIEKALKTFAFKNNLNDEFVEIFKKFPPFKKEYGSYSEKAVKKLLPLMRIGRYWDKNRIDANTLLRIENIINGEVDNKIRERVREKAIHLTELEHFKGLPEWLACYVVYDRHSETSDLEKWNTPDELDWFLNSKNPEGFKQHSLRNPIVEQVITETLRTVRDIWKKYGDITEIHLELGREMKNPADLRKKLTAKITENENTNLRIKALLAELVNHNDIENVRPYSPNQQEILKIYEEGALNSSIEIPDDIAKISKAGNPSKSELIKYKLWLEQKYRSPYTGEIIPLGRLFTSDYEIEHIIPQSRFFDDSISNKVICESEINHEKDNDLGYEFIKNNEGRIIELSFGKKVRIFTISEYEAFVKQHYGRNRGKMKKLLLEDLPEDFIQRQLTDSRYISKVVKSYLSKIVREKDEQEATSKNVISCTGGVTATLRQDWGLNEVWNRIITPRFERLNELTQSNKFGQWTNKDGKRVFQIDVPPEQQKGFNKKRIDHRHHAMDALVIACATRNHINYLNNAHASGKDSKIRYDLRNKLRRIEEIEVEKTVNGQRIRKKLKVAKEFIKPWDTFTQDAQKSLENIIVSFKQNLRVINKTVNSYQVIENGRKIFKKQIKGDSWAIRKPLHKDTVSGIVNLRLKKLVNLSSAIDQWENMVDKNLKTKIKQLINEGLDKKKMLTFFAEKENKWMDNDVSKTEIYYFSNEKEILVASRETLNDSFNSKTIESITDHGIRKILLKHLAKYNEHKEGKIIEHPELAFSPDGIDEMNKNIISLNGGKYHKPVIKVRTFEPKGNKFNVGTTGNKKAKFVEAAKGTNLFFAIYQNSEGKRSYESIQMNIIIERQKQGLIPVPEINEKGEQLLFHLSPNDLVYVPKEEEIFDQLSDIHLRLHQNQQKMIYKFVSCTENEGHFVPNYYASPILKNELGSNNKNQNALNGIQIKSVCWKLEVDRLGNIQSIIK